mmetsp:Transcript_43943/g.94646  ORF Transcript_43943/g.94646 Transcript_43943/m.94646 type:complete len:250 (+) Transcript_43943:372-1121(+)
MLLLLLLLRPLPVAVLQRDRKQCLRAVLLTLRASCSSAEPWRGDFVGKTFELPFGRCCQKTSGPQRAWQRRGPKSSSRSFGGKKLWMATAMAGSVIAAPIVVLQLFVCRSTGQAKAIRSPWSSSSNAIAPPSDPPIMRASTIIMEPSGDTPATRPRSRELRKSEGFNEQNGEEKSSRDLPTRCLKPLGASARWAASSTSMLARAWQGPRSLLHSRLSSGDFGKFWKFSELFSGEFFEGGCWTWHPTSST